MPHDPLQPAHELERPWDDEPIMPGAPLDWEALRAGGKVHLFFYLRDRVLAVALSDAAA